MLTLEQYQNLKPLDFITRVNRDINSKIKYKEDVVDKWNTPKETLKLGYGDCEDYAILKFDVLLQLGFTAGQLKLVYCFLKTGRLKEAHIVLEVSIGTTEYIMDNSMTLVLPLKERSDLEVLFKFNKDELWVNGEKTGHDPKKRLGQWGKVVERSIKENSLIG